MPLRIEPQCKPRYKVHREKDGTRFALTIPDPDVNKVLADMIDECSEWEKDAVIPDMLIVGLKQYAALDASFLELRGRGMKSTDLQFNGKRVIVVPIMDFCECACSNNQTTLERMAVCMNMEKLANSDATWRAGSAADGSTSSQTTSSTRTKKQKSGLKVEGFGTVRGYSYRTDAPTLREERVQSMIADPLRVEPTRARTTRSSRESRLTSNPYGGIPRPPEWNNGYQYFTFDHEGPPIPPLTIRCGTPEDAKKGIPIETEQDSNRREVSF